MGHPSAPMVCLLRCPNCSAVRMSWHGPHRHRMLSSVSVPPWANGMMWSGTVAAVMRPFALQSRHSGSRDRRALRSAMPLRPSMRPCRLRITLTPHRSAPCSMSRPAGLRNAQVVERVGPDFRRAKLRLFHCVARRRETGSATVLARAAPSWHQTY